MRLEDLMPMPVCCCGFDWVKPGRCCRLGWCWVHRCGGSGRHGSGTYSEMMQLGGLLTVGPASTPYSFSGNESHVIKAEHAWITRAALGRHLRTQCQGSLQHVCASYALHVQLLLTLALLSVLSGLLLA